MRRSAISALTTLVLLGAGTLVSTPAVAAPLACGGISTGSFSGSAGG
ncbi:MAG: chromosome partitioning protein ParB, partial [Rhodococcus erythropolis]|nr:chromosome partitioning protein ParB [Rhodococcus erythropolis]